MAAAQRIALATIIAGISFLIRLIIEFDTVYVVVLQIRSHTSRPSSERLYFPPFLTMSRSNAFR